MGTLVVAVLVLFAVLGAPLFAVFGASAMALFTRLPDTPITGAANDVFSEKFADSPLLVTIPMFTFAGYLMAESGTPRRLVNASQALLGWLPGGLAVVCLFASGLFTIATGGSGVTIIAVGGLLYPALVTEKYPERFALGLVTSGGSLGVVAPFSLPTIIYGVVAGVLIEKIWLATVVPGLVAGLALAAWAVVYGVRAKVPRTPFELRKVRTALWEAKWEALVPVVLAGGLMTGALRIHEAAAFTALYVLIIEVFVYKDISLRADLPRIIRESMTLVGAILIILATAVGFTAYLIQAEVPLVLLAAMERYISSPFTFLLVLNAFLLVVGMLMDIFSAIVVVVPLIVPIAAHFGINPYHLGVVFLLNLEIGYLTPPVGLNLFISSFRFRRPMSEVYRSVVVFIGLLVVALLVTTYVPLLSTYLPSLLKTEDAVDLAEPPGGAPGQASSLGVGELDGGAGSTVGDVTLDDVTLDQLGAEMLDDLDPDRDAGLEDASPPDAGTDAAPDAGTDAGPGPAATERSVPGRPNRDRRRLRLRHRR